MAFIIYQARGKELSRRPLDRPVVVGRAPDCDVSIHDILLSRHHCRLEPTRGGGWAVVDLGSKNGTAVDGQVVTRRSLRDGDVLRVGKTSIRFHAGRLTSAPAPALPGRAGRPAAVPRPADPHEALAGTVTNFEYESELAAAYQRKHNLPTPRPIPPEPAAYSREDIHSMLTEIASSSWDSIYADASRPLPPSADTATAARVTRARSRHRDFDLSLQAPPVRPKRPLMPGPPPRRSRVAALLRAAVTPLTAMHRWVAPPGGVRLF